MIRLLHGLEPDKAGTNLLHINAGSVGSFYGPTVADFPVENSVDLTQQGAWGLDVTPPSNGPMYLYCIKSTITNLVAVMAARARFATDVGYPSGYEFFRKLPFGFVYNAAWGGIPDFHLSCWPMPYIRLTGAQQGALWTALGAGSSHGLWNSLDLSGYVPDNARLVDLIAEVRYVGGAAGSGYVRSPGGANPQGLFVGSANPGAIGNTLSLSLRCDSNRKIEWMTTGDVVLYVTVLGYWMTEPA